MEENKMILKGNIEIGNFNYYKYPQQKIPSMVCDLIQNGYFLGQFEYVKLRKELSIIFETDRVKDSKSVLDEFAKEVGLINKSYTIYTFKDKLSMSFDDFQEVSKSLIATLNEFIEENKE